LAETRAELELLELRRGSFVSFLSELGIWDSQGITRGVDEVLSVNQGPAPVLFAHGNYLSSYNSIPRNATIIYCPRTHAAFGHGTHPFRSLLAAGTRVALGTDSLASNPDLDLWAEAQFLHHRYPDVATATLLRMATLSGAEALGCEGETGSLAAGKSADLVVLSFSPQDRSDPHELILSPSALVQAVLFRGKWVFVKDSFRCLQGA
jgi:cytosine/adenosine deaminase-related metal-dependent hydrolase